MPKNTEVDTSQTPSKILGELIKMNIATLSPWQKGVNKKLEEMGQFHAEEAMQQGLHPEEVAAKAGLDGKSLLSNLVTPPDTTSPAPQENQGKGFLKNLMIAVGSGMAAAGGHTDVMKALLEMSQANNPNSPENKLKAAHTAFYNNMAQNAQIMGNPQNAVAMMSSTNAALTAAGLQDYQGYQTTKGIAIKPKAAGVLAQLNPEQINAQAENLVNGSVAPSQLPRTYKNQILAAATQKDPNYSPAYADIKFATNKMSSSSFEKFYNNVKSFEDTFTRNADLALSVSESMDRSKFPILNQAIMAGKRTITGDPKAAQLYQTLWTAATEYARITSAPGATGQMVTDSAREEVRRMLSEIQNKGTIRGLLDPKTGTMRLDVQNRMGAMEQRRSEIKGEAGGGNSSGVPIEGGMFNGEKVLKVRKL